MNSHLQPSLTTNLNAECFSYNNSYHFRKNLFTTSLRNTLYQIFEKTFQVKVVNFMYSITI